MSYDVSLEMIDGKGDSFEFFSANYTSNMRGALDASGANVYDWNGWYPHMVLGTLRGAIADIGLNPEEYTQYDADNGWGEAQHMREVFLEPILDACERFPMAMIRVSR